MSTSWCSANDTLSSGQERQLEARATGSWAGWMAVAGELYSATSSVRVQSHSGRQYISPAAESVNGRPASLNPIDRSRVPPVAPSVFGSARQAYETPGQAPSSSYGTATYIFYLNKFSQNKYDFLCPIAESRGSFNERDRLRREHFSFFLAGSKELQTKSRA